MLARWVALSLLGLVPVVSGANPATAADPLVVLVFWSPDCGSCDPVMEQLAQLRARYRAQPVEFRAACIDDGAGPSPRHGAARLDVVPADAGLVRRYGVTGVPWVLITDRSGRVLATPSRNNSPYAVAAVVEMELVFRGFRQDRRS
ncbi:MAG TPA: thioredoxin fold domain-containing protein [Solimonas sp.]|nr:thioredoxin fold domain-containing protein [Solimonas sp.]